MGTIEDVRKVMQDFLAPELGKLSERVDGLAREMREGFARVESRLDRVERQIEVYKDVQRLKEEMAELRGERAANQDPDTGEMR